MKKEFVLGVDPGVSGALVLTDGRTLKNWPMPITVNGKDKSVHFEGVSKLLRKIRLWHGDVHVFLERAMPMAQGMKSAFNYGRGFEAVVIAISIHKLPVTLVEPGKWSKEMHEGVNGDLKAKAKSLIAVQRLYPKLVAALPRNTKGNLLDGPIDALLIAGYGMRKRIQDNHVTDEDFF